MSNENRFLSEQQEESLLLVTEAKKDLLTFCQLMDRNFEVAWFHEIIAEILHKALERSVARKKTRIILTIPPRHTKTTVTSNYFPAWALGQYPNLKVILSSYSGELAEKIGMKTRDIIAEEKYQTIFPGVLLRPDVKAKAKWMTTQKGEFTAVGIGGSITGTGGDIILIDDPHKDRAEAESDLQRGNVWEYYRSTLYSRLEGFGTVIVIMQRWHTDDLVGKLLEEERLKKEAGAPFDEWEVINFPAIAEQDEYWKGKLVRKEGEPLWPSKFPMDVLQNIRETQGTYNWISQYQQDPILSESQEFKQSMFKYYDPNSEEFIHKYVDFYTFIDPAISQKQESDNTCVLTIAKEHNGPNIYRVREDAGHFTPLQMIDVVFKHQKEYRSFVFLETVAFQLALKFSLEEEQVRRQQYFSIGELKSSGRSAMSKETKIRGLVPLYERGVVWHLKGDNEYEKELLQFPRGRRDDRIDAMSMILEAVVNTPMGMTKQYKPKWIGYGKKG